MILKKTKIYAYTKLHFKIWFFVKHESHLPDSKIYHLAKEKAHEINKENKYYASEKIRFVKFNGVVYRI